VDTTLPSLIQPPSSSIVVVRPLPSWHPSHPRPTLSARSSSHRRQDRAMGALLPCQQPHRRPTCRPALSRTHRDLVSLVLFPLLLTPRAGQGGRSRPFPCPTPSSRSSTRPLTAYPSTCPDWRQRRRLDLALSPGRQLRPAPGQQGGGHRVGRITAVSRRRQLEPKSACPPYSHRRRRRSRRVDVVLPSSLAASTKPPDRPRPASPGRRAASRPTPGTPPPLTRLWPTSHRALLFSPSIPARRSSCRRPRSAC
jgi:hypothetical protein